MTSALARLDLAPERQSAMLPLIRERLQARAGAARETSIDAHARKLVTLDGSQSKSFAEFAAFDLRSTSRRSTCWSESARALPPRT